MIVSKYRSAYDQTFAIWSFLKELSSFVLINIKTSLRISSIISRAIFTKLSQNNCHQLLHGILSGFFDSIVFEEVIAFCLNLHIKNSVRSSSSISHASFTELSG